VHLLQTTTHTEIRNRCLWVVRNIASSDIREHQQLVLNTGIINFLVPILRAPHQIDSDCLETACALLANLAKFRTPLEHFAVVLPLIVPLLDPTQVCAVASQVVSMLDHFAKDDIESQTRVAYVFAYEKGILVQRLIGMLSHRDVDVRLNTLHALGKLAMAGVRDTAQMHAWSIVDRIKLLATKARDGRELHAALFLISNLVREGGGKHSARSFSSFHPVRELAL
jgi:hypothetical protein